MAAKHSLKLVTAHDARPADALPDASAVAKDSLPAAPDDTTFRRQPRQSRGQRRVDLLLDAAATVIVRQGVQGATAEAIALEARTAKGSFYQFFPNRDAVLAALALRYSDDLRRIHEQAFPTNASGITLARLIDHIVKPLAAFHDDNPAFSRVFAIAEAAEGGRSAPGRIRSQLFLSVVERLDLLFASRNPALPARDRRRVALVSAAIGQAILARRDIAPASEKKALLDDLRRVLHAYLSPVLETVSTPADSERKSPAKRVRSTT
ncbi:MAG: TetR/AcrR family transcriptional regulator [Phycisphaerae bacterium]|nr:TetR/AcrR family transcriptional regulator [Gemmatimonadaceae bacterium]